MRSQRRLVRPKNTLMSIPTEGLTAEWKCEETSGNIIYDSTGDFNLTYPENIETSVNINSVLGKVGNGLWLKKNNTGSHPTSTELDLTDGVVNRPMTLVTWVKMDGSSSVVLGRKGVIWSFNISSNILRFVVTMQSGAIVQGNMSTGTPPRGHFVHLAVVFDPYIPEFIKIYIDNVKIDITLSGDPTTELVKTDTSSLQFFGGSYWAETVYDETKLYIGKALTEEEIAGIFTIENQ